MYNPQASAPADNTQTNTQNPVQEAKSAPLLSGAANALGGGFNDLVSGLQDFSNKYPTGASLLSALMNRGG